MCLCECEITQNVKLKLCVSLSLNFTRWQSFVVSNPEGWWRGKFKHGYWRNHIASHTSQNKDEYNRQQQQRNNIEREWTKKSFEIENTHKMRHTNRKYKSIFMYNNTIYLCIYERMNKRFTNIWIFVYHQKT